MPANQPRARILLADDESLFLSTTAQLLRRTGFDCTCVPDGRAALEALEHESFDAALVDLNMPGNLKLELLREGRSQHPAVPLIVVTGMPTLPSAIESVRLGIADYLLKPIDIDDLIATLERVLARRERAMSKPRANAEPLETIIGRSDAILKVQEIVERIAKTDINVLILGESGTGKEVVARAIHARGPRADGPFQVVDCASIPDTLLESTLFGHAKGAFTGAIVDQPGLLRRSDGGTAFLDELGELPLTLQPKLLRVLQFQRFTPVGEDTEVQIDTRFISATNRDLDAAIRRGMFRRDLFYRLAVVQITLPPLRDRGDDVVLLAQQFLDELTADGGPARTLSPATLDIFRRYAWPGNVRELRNVIHRAGSLVTSDVIEPADLPDELRPGRREPISPLPQRRSRLPVVVAAEREHLFELLKRHRGNVAQAAREVGMSRQGLHKLLMKHDLAASDFRGPGDV